MRPRNNLFSSVLSKPSVLLSTQSNTVVPSKSTKRKLADSLIEDEDDNSLFKNNTSSSTTEIPKINVKRPRMLDMNKIRSIVLGTNDSINETLMNTSENPIEWKTFPTYDEYISSKKHTQRSLRLPTLTHNDYYTKPAIEELHSYFNEQGQCFVKKFTVGRKHYGSVTFQGLHMNLAGLDLDRLGKYFINERKY